MPYHMGWYRFGNFPILILKWINWKTLFKYSKFLLCWTLEQSFSRFTCRFWSFRDIFGSNRIIKGHLVPWKQGRFGRKKRWCRHFGFTSGSTIARRQSNRISDFGLLLPPSQMNLFCGIFLVWNTCVSY